MVRHPITLQLLLQLVDLPACLIADLPADIRARQVQAVTRDSREICEGSVFIAISGSRVDGHDFLTEVAAAGALCAIVGRRDSSLPLPQIEVGCPASVYSQICLKLSVGKVNPVQTAGVTGTNGKTTTTWMLQSILQAAGRQTGVVGTICNHDGLRQLPSTMTTPDAKVLAVLYGSMSRNHTTHCAMEISSHALDQNRASGLQLSAAAITNITQDHFDYHGDSDSYRSVKASIAKLLYPEAPLLLNLDDAGCQAVLKDLATTVPIITCGVKSREAEISAKVLQKNHRSTTARLCLAQGDCEVRIKLVGDHNVANCLMAAGLAEQMGVGLDAIAQGVQSLVRVPGRLQRVDMGQPFQVFIDYAHTPDALRHCLQTLKSFTAGQVICVFGAGGDRDRSKRSGMGEAASLADRCIVTSDNSRSESPEVIISEVVAGISATTSMLPVVQREVAISVALQEASAGDTVVIAGRGHETMQEVCGRFVQIGDDASCVQAVLESLGYFGTHTSAFAKSA